jgi:putative intracellular protease/amidase
MPARARARSSAHVIVWLTRSASFAASSSSSVTPTVAFTQSFATGRELCTLKSTRRIGSGVSAAAASAGTRQIPANQPSNVRRIDGTSPSADFEGRQCILPPSSPRACGVAMAEPAQTEIGILLFEGITALDAIGPYEVLQRVPGARVRMLGTRRGNVRTQEGSLSLGVDAELAECAHPDLVVVPGGLGVERLLADEAVLGWLRGAHATSRWTTSVCTGSLLLGAAGLLRGLRATCHWGSLERMREYGAEPTLERVVFEGKIVTAAGVSSGIDMALALVARLMNADVAQAIQLSIEYDPQPPFDAGSPAKAAPHVVELVKNATARARARAARA